MPLTEGIQRYEDFDSRRKETTAVIRADYSVRIRKLRGSCAAGNAPPTSSDWSQFQEGERSSRFEAIQNHARPHRCCSLYEDLPAVALAPGTWVDVLALRGAAGSSSGRALFPAIARFRFQSYPQSGARARENLLSVSQLK